MTDTKARFWAIGYAEARGHAIVAAAVLWFAFGLVMVTGDGYASIAGWVKGADFVHFYTLGRQVLSGRAADLYDATAQFQLQRSLVPESAGARYIPVYPPQAALLFVPFALWSYGIGLLLWMSVTIGSYTAVVVVLRRTSLRAVSDTTFIAVGAAAFPPLAQLVLHGQTTLLPLTAFFVAWCALDRDRPYLAGLGLGLLAVKPQFGLVLAVVAVVCREWRLMLGGLTSLCLQAAIVSATLGSASILAYLRTVPELPRVASLLEPKPYQLHSLQALVYLLPASVAFPAWLLLVVPILVTSVWVWRAPLPLSVRLGMLVIASVLVNPHLGVYDATVLILPGAWIGGWALEQNHNGLVARRFWTAIYGMYVFLLFPTAYLIRLQVSVVLLCTLFFSLAWHLRKSATEGAERQGVTSSTGPPSPFL